MEDLSFVSVNKIREYLEKRSTNRRTTFVRQKNTFGKVASIVQEFSTGQVE